MEILQKSISAVKHFFSGKSRFFLLVTGLLVFLFIAALIVSIVQCVQKPGKPITFSESNPVIPVTELVPPKPAALIEDYYFSRISNEKWSDADVDRWFTEPDSFSIDALGDANDSLVSNITGAAP